MNRAFAFRDFAAGIILRFSEMFLNDPNAFDQNALFLWKHRQNFPGRAPKISRDHLHMIALLYVALDAIHKTSGASDTIFMKLRSRKIGRASCRESVEIDEE